MHITQTILSSLLLSFIFIGCGETASSSSKETKIIQTPKETIEDAENAFTAGDDQHVLEGEEVVIQSSILDRNKTFTKVIWSENGKVLGHEEVLHTKNLSVGKHHITLQMEDSEGKIYTDVIVITINEENESNQPPLASDFMITLDEDTPIMTHLKGGDADGDSLHYLFTSHPLHGTISGSAAHLTYTPDSNYYGKDSFTFKTYDGQVDSRIATVSIVINSVNDVPIFQTIPTDKTLKIDENLSLDINVSDADGDELSFLVTPSWIGFKDGKLDISPTKDNTGKHHVKLEADDKHGKKASFEFNLEVVREIHIKPIEALFISEDDSSYVGEFHLVDEEKIKESIIYTTYNYPKGFHHGQGNGFSVDLSSYQSLKKDENITFTIGVLAEVGGVTDRIDFNLTIIGKNDVPKFGTHKFPVATEDTLYDIDLLKVFKITDADMNSTDLNITVKNLPSWLHLSDGRLSGTPTNKDVSSTMLTIFADDKVGYPSTSGSSLVVKNINDAPIAIIHRDKNITNQYETITFDANQSYDVDKEDTIKSYLWSVDNNQTYTSKSFTTSFKTVGEHKIELTVEDKNNTSNTSTTMITVNPVTPMFSLKNIVLSENNSTSEIIIKSQNTDLIYTAINQPKPTWFDLTATGLFTLSTNDDKYQSYPEGKPYVSTITVRGTDKYSDMSKDENFTITIIGKNDAPIAHDDSKSIDEDHNITFNILTNDTDVDSNHTLTVTEISVPSRGMSSYKNGNITFSPIGFFDDLNATQEANVTLNYTIQDEYNATSSAKVTITIIGQDDALYVSQVATQEVHLDGSSIIQGKILALDKDDSIIFTDTNSSDGLEIHATTGAYIFTPPAGMFDYLAEGMSVSYSVPFKVNNSQEHLAFTIFGKNDAPKGNSDVNSTQKNIAITLDVLANDKDADQDTLSINSVTTPQHGTATISNDKIIYTPETNFIGEDTFSYNPHDGHVEGSNTKVTIIVGTPSIYTQHTISTAIKASRWLEMADVDNDGDLDILSAARDMDASNIAWYENSGDFSSFIEHVIVENDGHAFKYISAKDLNGDGLLDIVYASHDNAKSIMICDNEGNKTFTCQDRLTSSTEVDFLDIIDVDNDGKLDIVSSSWNIHRIDWYKNQGNNSFSTSHIIDIDSSLNGVSSLSHTDINDDNNMDLLVSVSGLDNLFLYKNDGQGNFTKETIISTTPAQKGYQSIVASDIDNDGKKDVISVALSAKEIAWQKNSGGSFDAPTVIDPNIQAYYASSVDIDDDGDKDVLTASATEIIWYENEQDGTIFTKHIAVSGLVNMQRRVFASDMDNDGHMDFISGDEVGNLIVYENHTADNTTLLPKTGDSDDGGFGRDYSFTRDDSTAIVTDTDTGLMWQDDSAVSSNPKNWTNVQGECQNVSVGGFSDWRFPNRHELYYLAQKNSTVLDNIFQNIGTSTGGKDYWTSSLKKVYVDFNDAHLKKAYGKNYTRCVRGKPIAFHLIRDDNKKMVLDNKHKLIWEDGEDSNTRTDKWDEAKSACEGLDYLGVTAWRLPNIHELYAIFNDDGQDNAFKHKSIQTKLLSSTSHRTANDKVYGIDTNTSLGDRNLDINTAYDYRCVSDMVK